MPREDPSRAMPGRRGAERRLAHMSGRWAVRQANAADATLPRCDPCRPSHVLFGAFVAEATAGVWTLAASCARLQAMSEDRGVGVTHVQGVVTGPTRKQAEVRFLVDSGAMYSLLPYEVWREIELSPRRVQAFGLADGTRIERAVSGCHIRLPQ